MNSTHWTRTSTQVPFWMLPEWGPATCRPAWQTMLENIENLSARYEPISLRGMEEVALLNRVDTKFVMTTRQLASALARLEPEYWMLEVNGLRLMRYRTLYFDSPAFDLYHAQVNDRPERYKVRSREYVDTRLSFLEVKHRTRKDRTIKERIHTGALAASLSAEMNGWLRSVAPLDGANLEPRLLNTFLRLTLVSKRCCERVTLDLDIAFSTEERRILLDGVAIAEVKMEVDHQVSPFIQEMRRQRIHARGFSKYAYGTARLYDQVKKNSIKPKMLWVNKLMKGSMLNG